MTALPGGIIFLISMSAARINSIASIQNPTLRLLAKWLCMVVQPRSDICASVALPSYSVFMLWPTR